MCGISCVVTLHGHERATQAERSAKSRLDRSHLSQSVNESLEIIKHRGPDAKGQWISDCGRIALGHNRLAIVDLSPEAEQPFHSEDGRVHAVVNGELYDHDRIRTALQAKGHVFQSACDSEIVIALYAEYGLGFLSHLRGEFTLCLYDAHSQTFYAAVDRYSIKPLFYTILEGRLLLASEAKAFLAYGWQPEWDVASFRDNGWLCDDRTMFAGVRKVLPGQYLSLTSFSHMSQQKYWDLEFRPKSEVESRTIQNMVTGVRERLLDAVRVRLRADVPVGIYLSGGIDSSAIAGMVKHLIEVEGVRLGSRPKTDLINCFSIKFQDEMYDEEPIARRTAEWLGVHRHIIEMTEALFAEQLEETAWHNEFANPDLNSVGKFALSKLTRDMGVKVVLTGEGSDEHFGGYSELLTDYVRERDPSYAQAAPSEGQRAKTFQELEGSVHSGPEETASAEFARKQINNVSFVGFTQTAALGDALFQTWTTKCYGTIDKRLVAVHNTLDGRTRDLISRQWHPLHSALYIWTKTSLANALLTALGDRVEMAHSIEGRQPFLDHKVTEYAMALPPSLKIKYDAETGLYKEKWILVEAMKPFVTAELYKRKKHAFGAPVKWEVGGALYKLFATVMTRENVEGLGFLEWEKCEGLMAGAFGRHDRAMWRQLITIVQLIMLGKRFGVKRAEMEVVL